MSASRISPAVQIIFHENRNLFILMLLFCPTQTIVWGQAIESGVATGEVAESPGECKCGGDG